MNFFLLNPNLVSIHVTISLIIFQIPFVLFQYISNIYIKVVSHKERAASQFTDSFPMYRLGSSTLSEEINSSNSVSSRFITR